MPKEDAFEPQANGTVKFVIDGNAFTLRRPKVKQFRLLRETLIEVGGSDDDSVKAVDSGKLPPTLETAESREEKEDALLSWWRLVFDTLGDETGELPDNDDLPTWLFDAAIIPKLLETWLRSPQVLGK